PRKQVWREPSCRALGDGETGQAFFSEGTGGARLWTLRTLSARDSRRRERLGSKRRTGPGADRAAGEGECLTGCAFSRYPSSLSRRRSKLLIKEMINIPVFARRPVK